MDTHSSLKPDGHEPSKRSVSESWLTELDPSPPRRSLGTDECSVSSSSLATNSSPRVSVTSQEIGTTPYRHVCHRHDDLSILETRRGTMLDVDQFTSSDSNVHSSKAFPIESAVINLDSKWNEGLMSYAAMTFAPPLEGDASQRTAQNFITGINKFLSQDSMNIHDFQKDLSGSNLQNRDLSIPVQPSTKKKAKQKQSRKGRSSKDRHTESDGQRDRSKDLEEFTKLYPRTGQKAETPVRDPSSFQISPTDPLRRDCSYDLEHFKKFYPRTGRSESEELQEELSKVPTVANLRVELSTLPNGSNERQEKIDECIRICQSTIRDQYTKFEQHLPKTHFDLAEKIRVEIRNLNERLAIFEEIKEETRVAQVGDDSHTGSFYTALEGTGSFSTAPEVSSEAISSEDSAAVKMPHKTRRSARRPGRRPLPATQIPSPEDPLYYGHVDQWLDTGILSPHDGRTSLQNGSFNMKHSRSLTNRSLSLDGSRSEDGEMMGYAGGSFTENWKQNRDIKETHANDEENSPAAKKALNFDSPAFTPSAGVSNGGGNNSKTNPPTLPSQAAAAAPFTPRGIGSISPNPPADNDPISTLNIAHIREFTPGSFDAAASQSVNGTPVPVDPHLQYDPFHMTSISQAMPTAPYNPYMEDNNGLAADPMSSYYTTQNNYVSAAQPLQYHLYAPQGPHRDDLLPYQRQAHEFFIPEKLRESFQRRAEATLQVMPNSQLPVVDPFHSLVALDTNIQHQNTQLFGYPTWLYKALSQKNGNYYCLRRLEGYRPTNDRAIRSVKDWRRVDGTHVVKVHDAFTTRAFGDSSLVFVTDYHPLSRTLSEHHHGPRNRAIANVHESVLWGYIVQISLALKEIHQSNLAARCIDPSKVILTDKNRIRLNACSIPDVIQFEAARPLIELQQEDFQQFGMLILSIATHTPVTLLSPKVSPDQLSRDYSQDLVEVVRWLLTPAPSPSQLKSIGTLFQLISMHTAEVLSKLYSSHDVFTSEFFKELENSRMTRLLIKLNFINERPEYAHNPDWAETGERYALKMMRDYIFHQVDEQGRPSIDLGWVIGCLNRLDAGSDERVELVSRDGNNSFIVSWRECKGLVAKSWSELMSGTSAGAVFVGNHLGAMLAAGNVGGASRRR